MTIEDQSPSSTVIIKAHKGLGLGKAAIVEPLAQGPDHDQDTRATEMLAIAKAAEAAAAFKVVAVAVEGVSGVVGDVDVVAEGVARVARMAEQLHRTIRSQQQHRRPRQQHLQATRLEIYQPELIQQKIQASSDNLSFWDRAPC